jgi:hypothetical protein
MEFENDEIRITPENRKDVLAFIFKNAIEILKKDSHIKLLSLKTEKVKKEEFLKKVICKKTMLSIIQTFFEEGAVPGTHILHKQMFNELLDAIIIEWKNKIFSSLSDDGIMGLYFDSNADKIFWAFIQGNKKIPNEKDILKEKRKWK